MIFYKKIYIKKTNQQIEDNFNQLVPKLFQILQYQIYFASSFDEIYCSPFSLVDNIEF